MTTAAATYAARTANIDTLIERLQAALQNHAGRAAAQPESWGFPGDLSRVEQQLAEMVETMGG